MTSFVGISEHVSLCEDWNRTWQEDIGCVDMLDGALGYCVMHVFGERMSLRAYIRAACRIWNERERMEYR